MSNQFYTGSLVEIVPIDIEKDFESWMKWNRDSDYLRFLDDVPANQYSLTQMKDWFEKEGNENSFFIIKSVEDHKTIGFVELAGYDWVAGNAWVGIAIGEPEYRSKGYGTDAMNLILKFAFHTQNLHRVSLGVFGYNPRAIRCYEKCGYKYEGTMRECIYKEDQRWDILNMGILRNEWEALQASV